MDAVSPAMVLYRVSRTHAFFQLLVAPWLSLAGVAMVVQMLAKFASLLAEAREFLSHGPAAWIAAAPVTLIVVPFLFLFGYYSAQGVAMSWLDAVSSATTITEGEVGLASSDSFGFMSGSSYVSGTVNRLSVAHKMFTSLPTSVIKRIRVGERLRVVHTPRTNHVLAVVRCPVE